MTTRSLTSTALLPASAPPASLERTCVHEHGHLVVARALGASGFVRLVRIVAGGNREVVGYAGSFQLFGELDEREWRIVALAGTLAEWIAEVPDFDESLLLDRLHGTPDPLPATDARLAAGYDDEDVRRCMSLLKRHWGEVCAEALDRATSLDRAAERRHLLRRE